MAEVGVDDVHLGELGGFLMSVYTLLGIILICVLMILAVMDGPPESRA